MIGFNLGRAEEKEVELARLVEEVNEGALHCDKLQERSMKGILIIS